MALLISCKSCRKPLKEGEICPSCGDSGYLFKVDFFPDGRNGKRLRIPVDESIQDIEIARGYDAALRSAALESRKPGSEQKSLSGSTIEDLTPDYLKWVKLNRTPKTYAEREYSMVYINKIVGHVPAAAFNDKYITLYQTARKAQKVSNKTVNKELYYVLSFLRWCREEQKIEVRDVKMKKLPYARPLPIILSPDEVRRLLDIASPFYRAFILCLYSTDLRFAEAQLLRREDIDLENKVLRAKQKGGTWKILPMSDMLIEALKELGLPGKNDEFIFISKRTRRPIVNVRKGIKALCVKAGVSKHVYPHLFRHSGATHLLASGANLRTVQEMLGHADVESTEWYTHIDVSHLRAASNAVETGLKKPASTPEK